MGPSKYPKIIMIPAILCLLMVISLLAPGFSNAQTTGDYTLLAPLPCIPGNGISCPASSSANGVGIVSEVSFKTYVQYAMNLIIALSAVAAVVMIVWGGLKYMTTTTVSGKGDGLKIVQDAIKGLLLVLCAYLILRTIDPRLVQIPNTLVPKLTVRSDLTKNSSMTFFDQLAAQANTYQVNTQEAIAARNAAKAEVTQAQTKLDEIDSKLNSIYNGEINATPEEASQLEVERQQIIDQMNDAKIRAATQQATSIYNYVLTGLATNANKDQISTLDKLLFPGDFGSATRSRLEVISKATGIMYKATQDTDKIINDPQNPNNSQNVGDLIKISDESMLKATQLYVETFNANIPVSVEATKTAIEEIIAYKISFALSDPAKNQQKNDLLANLCKQEAGKISKQQDGDYYLNACNK